MHLALLEALDTVTPPPRHTKRDGPSPLDSGMAVWRCLGAARASEPRSGRARLQPTQVTPELPAHLPLDWEPVRQTSWECSVGSRACAPLNACTWQVLPKLWPPCW